MKDWNQWHGDYENPDSNLSRRLVVVQRLLRAAIHDVAEGPVNVISLCAGDGRDVGGVFSEQPHRLGQALLVEQDAELVEAARLAIAGRGLADRIDVRHGDAAQLSNYADHAPAHIVMACGVFGNIDDADVYRTIETLPALVRPGGTFIWTRSRRAPDLTPRIREHFERTGFAELEFVAPPDVEFSVGAHRFEGTSEPLDPSASMFTFVV